MFIDNKYTKWYYTIVKNAQTRVLSGYVEKHHIIPKSLGGSNLANNIARLTQREHFVCHQILIRMLAGDDRYKMVHAAWRLAHVNGQKVNSRQYEQLRTQRSLLMTGRKNPKVSAALLGRKQTAESIAKRIATVTGQKRPKTSEALKSVPRSSVSAALSGRKQPQELVDKRAASLRGKPSGALGRTQSLEEKEMRSVLMKGRISPKKGTQWSPERRAAYEASKLGKVKK